jgi:hypothetical protein
MAHVKWLASPDLDGRMTGSPGAEKAAAYLVDQFWRVGLRPLPGQADFRLPFEFTSAVADGGTTLDIESGGTSVGRWAAAGGVQALSFSDSSSASGPVVFAGYGLVVPDSQGVSYDSYATLDVTDKVVVVLRYFPEDAGAELRDVLARYSGLRYKAMAARDRGARALVVVTGPRSPNAGRVVPMTFDTANAGSGIVAASVAGEVADALFGAAGRSLAEVQQSFDTGNPHVAGFAIEGVTATISAKVSRQTATSHNVVGYLPGTAESAFDKPYVIVGAHYDHLGRGQSGNSLARSNEEGQSHLGADDNASGVSAVLSLVESLAPRPRKRGLIVGFWAGEEMGLLGSAAFTAEPPVPLAKVAAYVNFDMVGRMRDNRLTVQAVGSAEIWPSLLAEANATAGFELLQQADPYLPTDSASFNLAGVPTLNFFTGGHEDYHRPSDDASRINYEDLERVAAFGATMTARLLDLEPAPAFVKVDRPTQSGGSRDTVRVFTGTIPDYATEAEGLLLGGVIGGGPADQAGLAQGDVIVELGGRRIANIYDYTYALDALKVDQPVTVVYLRGGERRETTMTPRARR